MLRKVLFLTVLMLSAQIGLADAQERTITVIGEGRADVQPDMATVQLGVVTEAPGGAKRSTPTVAPWPPCLTA